MGTPYGLLGCH